MKKIILINFLILTAFTTLAAPKKVKIANASDTVLKACVYVGSSMDDLGVAVGTFQSLQAGKDYTFEYRYEDGKFIHAAVILQNGDIVIVNTHPVSSSDKKEITVNITKPNEKSVDRPEMDRMRKLIDDEVANFSKVYPICIPVDGDATQGLQEYLGAILIVDTAQKDLRKAIKLMYTARQLNISENPPVSGRNFTESFRISKDFAAEANVSIPTAFSADLNFTIGDLQEVSLSCKSIGKVLFPTRPGETPVGTLISFDEKNIENVTATVTKTLDTCKTCILQQIDGVLAHGGIAVNVKRFKKSTFAANASAASVVTSKGAYTYQNGYDYFDVISPRVIALGVSAVNLKTAFAQTVIEKLKSKRDELDKQRQNQQLTITILNKEITEIDETLGKLNSF